MIDLKIIQADNGFILVSGTINDDNTKEFQYVVVEDNGKEHDCMKRLLESVAEHFGCHYDGFSRHNLRISFNRKGDEVE